ncbi:HAD family hydrolase [Sagittula salina]|uniref:phosphoglycolate phosphatase n=1 Tax=Sagittula salina TaxID=2820268 RepID=A0A940MW99_9RHOB|nr:HAD family hydrolase [Sagittula salina]MBP0484034.1 HAD family hydrolase [Sagittula salina]
MRPHPQAILFDKDGTLFDFGATWNVFAARLLGRLSAGNVALAQAAADVLRYDLADGVFLPDSPAIAGTNREVAELLALVIPRAVEALEAIIIDEAARAPLVETVPLGPLMDTLLLRGLRLGVMTNDTFDVAEAHLTGVGVRQRFDFVAGADSGFGAKPAPEPLLAFAKAVGVVPERVIMVGDSTHDLLAGAAAGMRCVGVLTGMAGPEVLGPHAEVVLEDIGALPHWLDTLKH